MSTVDMTGIQQDVLTISDEKEKKGVKVVKVIVEFLS